MFKKILVSTAVLGALSVGAFSANISKVSADSAENMTAVATSMAHVQIRSNAVGDGWSTPYGDEGSQWVVNLASLRGQQVKLLSQSVDTVSGMKWVKVQLDSVNNGQPFYVDSSRTTAQDFMFRQDTTSTYGVWSDDDSLFLTKPWGVKGANVISSVKSLNGMTFVRPTMTTDVNGTTWAKITVNGKTGYINANNLHEISKSSAVAYK